MKNYELVLLLDPSIQDKEQKEFIAELEAKFKKNIVEKDDIGILSLTHDLWGKKGNDRFYFLSYYFQGETDMSDVIKEYLLYNKLVYRYFFFVMWKEEEKLSYAKTQEELQKFIDEWKEKKRWTKMWFFLKTENEKYVSWKSIPMLKVYMTRFWDIKPRRYTWNSVTMQKKLRKAIIRSREMWLLEYIK